MQVIIILMVCSIVLAGGFLLAFIWASKTGQFDDDVSPAHRILFDDKVKKKNSKS
jgi:cbb3-type cytochrome oxidase maturation protein